MFNNVALDVFIGLTFVFLLYSLLASILQEAIAGLFNLRAVVLVKAIRVMLNDRQQMTYSTKWLLNVLQRFWQTLKNQWNHFLCHLPDNSLAKAFYKHPSIKYLSSNIVRSKPSYISPGNFSSTLAKILRGRFYDGTVPEIVSIFQTLYPQTSDQLPVVNVGLDKSVTANIKPETLDQLRQLFVDAKNDVEKFKELLENWFNETMDRANGWYKRQTKRILFLIGLVIALIGNVDTVKIYHLLATNKDARNQMVQLASRSQNKYDSLITRDSTQLRFDSAAYEAVMKDINSAGSILGIGWSSVKALDSLLTRKHYTDSVADAFTKNKLTPPASLARQQNEINAMVSKIEFKRWNGWSLLGWIITALALTLGAPFWFDLLNKFISLRSTGAKPNDKDSNLADEEHGKTSVRNRSITVSSGSTGEEAVG